MTDKQLKQYYNFYADLWQYFKRYAWDGVNEGLNDINFWDAYDDATDLMRKYADIPRVYSIINAVQEQLWAIGGAVEWSEARCDEAFQFCRASGKDYLQYLMVYIDKATAGHPERSEYIIPKLAELLTEFGHEIDPETLTEYAKAGWLLRI